MFCTSSSVHRNSVQGIVQLRSEDIIITIEADCCVDIIIISIIISKIILMTTIT